MYAHLLWLRCPRKHLVMSHAGPTQNFILRLGAIVCHPELRAQLLRQVFPMLPGETCFKILQMPATAPVPGEVVINDSQQRPALDFTRSGLASYLHFKELRGQCTSHATCAPLPQLTCAPGLQGGTFGRAQWLQPCSDPTPSTTSAARGSACTPANVLKHGAKARSKKANKCTAFCLVVSTTASPFSSNSTVSRSGLAIGKNLFSTRVPHENMHTRKAAYLRRSVQT